MHWRHEIQSTFAALGRSVSDGVIEELAQHADAAWQAARADGMPADAATARVRGLIEAWCRATNGPRHVERPPLVESAAASPSWFAGLALDARHAVRLFRREPWFADVSMAMIALGIGVTTAIFSVVNGVLLTPLPWPNASRLVRVAETREGGTVNLSPVFSNATYLEWQKRSSTIDALGGYSETAVAVDTGGGLERVRAAQVTASMFPMLGVVPAIGPGITAADEEHNVVVLSHGFWRERFGGAADVVGQSLRIGSDAYTVVGVMPERFIFPSADVRLWLPAHIPVAIIPGGGRAISLFSAIALLKPGVTPAAAAQEAQAVARALPDLGPVIPAVFGSKGPAIVSAVPLADAFVGDVKAVLAVLLAAGALLWLAAVGNVASMQMARAVARRREMGIRAAIGAGVGRLVRQLVVENGLLAATGAALGILLAAALLRALPALLPADFPRAETIAIDTRVVTVAALLAAIASMAIALWPARLAARLEVQSEVRGDAGAGAASLRGAVRSRRLIAALQVAIAAALLIGGSLLAQSFMRQWRLDRGFDTANVLTARIRLPPSLKTGPDKARVFDALIAGLSKEPGVIVTGISDSVPLGGSERRFASTVAEPGKPRRTVSALLREVTPGYFRAVGLRLSAGRLLDATDTLTAEPVAVVNRTFARRYLSDQPIGEVLPAVIDNQRESANHWKIVGVLDDALRASPADPVQPEIFVSTGQMTDGPSSPSFIVAKTSGDPSQLVPVLRRLVRSADADATVEQPMTMEARLMMSLARPRLYAVLLGGFAVFAGLIALTGLFGGLSYGVAQRTREISVRTALGATPAGIVRLIVSEGAMLTGVGVVLGMAAAGAGARALGSYLYGISVRDPLTYVVVALVVLAAGLAASALPARRAAAIDPLTGLRN